MSALQAALRRIEESAEGPDTGAFFDYDGTLIDGFSAGAYFMDRLQRRDMSRREVLDLIRMARKGDLSEAEFGEVIGKGVLEWVGRSETEMRTERKKNSLLGRYGESIEVAYPILWLASDEASYVTGAALMVDGGLSAM